MQTQNIKLNKSKGKQVLIITGLSGAGKTSFMRALEDFGFYCVDNLPFPLLSTFLSLMFQAQVSVFKIALGIDARGHKFLNNFIFEMEKIKGQSTDDIDFKVIFLSANEDTLLRRFQETRRNHPLADDGISVVDAIKKEKEVLEPIKMLSDIVLDTDILNIHELRKWVRSSFSDELEQRILVNLISFGFKYGVPAESNLVYDLRFLPNPYFQPKLRAFSGKDKPVQNYLFEHDVVNDYWSRLKEFVEYSIKNFYKEGRFFVNIAIGCTGGKHRSVAFVEKLSGQNWDHVKFLVRHRDLGRE